MIEWRGSAKGRIPYSLQLALAEAALEREPGSPVLLAQIGVLQERLRRPRKARAALEASLAADPDGFNRWAELAKVCARLGDIDAATAVCSTGLERRPRANLARIWGNLLVVADRTDAAIDSYRMALDLPGFDLAALQSLFGLRTARPR